MTNTFNFNDPVQRERVRLALEAFLAAEDEDEMAEVIADYPFVAETQFERGVEQLIDHASQAGDPDALFRLRAQLELRYSVLAMDVEDEDEQALHAFLFAADEAAATAIFEQYAQVLHTPAMEKALYALEAADPESDLHLEERRALWRRLSRSH